MDLISEFPDFVVLIASVPEASQVVLVVKDPPAKAGDITDTGSIPGSGRSPGGGQGYPFQYSCLKNPMDRGVCWVTVHGVTRSWTRLQRLSTPAAGDQTVGIHRQGDMAGARAHL